MKTAIRIALLFSALWPASAAVAASGSFATGQYRNLFHEYLGKTDADVKAKIDSTYQQLFHGDENSERLFYAVAGDMAYIPDIANNDVRSEGLSYGMMITVQMNRQKEFNQIWKYAKHYMHHESGPFRGYFAWHTAFDGRKLSPGPAPDGEEWFVMALFFASHRWGNGEGIFNYEAEAQALLRTMIHKHEDPDRGSIGSMFDPVEKQINFTPDGPGARFTDPSYHLPAFSELWSRWASDPADRKFLAEVTATSRALFKKAAHPKTGLMPDYSYFDGRPHRAQGGTHEDFRYDAWRTLSNPALDYSWWGADAWEVEQSNRVLGFLTSKAPNIPNCFKVDGTPVSTDVNAPGLIAMAATAGLAADRTLSQPFVQQLWDMKVPSGHYRYYNGLLTMIGLLEVSGNFRIYGPVTAP
jgi:oligosaccharide reducing-end xylanase